MKKLRYTFILIMTLCLASACLFGCDKNKGDDNNKTPDVPTQELVQISDHLYETTYTTDFDWSAKNTAISGNYGCLGVQNGYFRGRNYDWTYADTDLCVVHTTVTENRKHASVGVTDLSFLSDINFDRIPFLTVDGINDAGVCIQVNVMPYGENGVISHTETTEDDLSGSAVVRFVLDYASSVEEALNLLKEKDIHSELGTLEELHWMISGPTNATDKTIKTVVVEVFPDGLHITENFVDNKPIMVNFNVSNFDGTPSTLGLGFGYERWEIVNENYDQANSVMGTFDLMEKVYYSKLYDLYGESFWYSEYVGTNLSVYYDEETLKTMLGEDTYNFYIQNYGAVYYTDALWNGEKVINGDISKTGILAPAVEVAQKSYNAQNQEDGSLWITVHTSVYDLEHLTLDIQVRESQDHFHFTIGK